jgi:hypothetical protein
MDPHRNIFLIGNVALDQGNMFLVVYGVAVVMQDKFAVPGGDGRLY